MKNDNNYNIEDLIFDDSFLEFVEGKNEKSSNYWENWLLKHPEKKDEFIKAVQILKTLLNTKKSKVYTDKHKALQNLLQKIEQNRPKHKIRILSNYMFRVASIILFAVLISSILWFLSGRITRNTGSYCELIVPVGEKSQIVLADGTHVWVNSGSRLKYPTQFGNKSREVFLQGEAYFDVVKKDNHSPFIVNTKDVKIKVLGTAFNVKCYPGDVKTQTTVIRGLVEVTNTTGIHKSVLIKPNQMATIVNGDRSGMGTLNTIRNIEVKNVKTEPVVSWKDQLLVFSDEPLNEIAVKLERWFNVKIKILDDSLGKECYNGKFVHNETIYQVLEAIQLTTPIKYKVINNEIIIDKK